MVPPESPVRGPADLAGVPVGWAITPAATLFGVPLYIAEAFGFRKVLDATFMIGFLVTGPDVAPADVGKYLAALRHREIFAATQAWTRRVFPALPEPAPYDEAVLS